MPITAEAMTEQRRAIKARQSANARAAARNRTQQHFSMTDVAKDRQIRSRVWQDPNAKRLERMANGDRLLAQVQAVGSITLVSATMGYERWVADCRDLIEAVKRLKTRSITWNSEWYSENRLNVAVVK